MIKSIKTEDNSEYINDYPVLLSDDFLIILVSGEDTGVVIWAAESEPYKVGDYSETWDFSSFYRYTGKVILENSYEA